MNLPEAIESESQLDELLSTPSAELVAALQRLDGDLLVLGVAGKMGITLARLAQNALRAGGRASRVTGVARFSDPRSRESLEKHGIATLACDLLDRAAVEALPDARNVIYMAARKFGTEGDAETTWAINVVAPTHVVDRYRQSRIVAFSTGCVYPLVTAVEGGCSESVPPAPIGDYAQSAFGRERVFGWASRERGTPVCLFRLNYAVDLRYGVLHDIGQRILAGAPVDLTVGHFNAIWQGDANEQALRSLELCASPAVPINVSGPETWTVEEAARRMAEIMEKGVTFRGEPGGPCYLTDARRAVTLFGPPRVPLPTLIRWQALWLLRGGRSLGKPTHFEETSGRF